MVIDYVFLCYMIKSHENLHGGRIIHLTLTDRLIKYFFNEKNNSTMACSIINDGNAKFNLMKLINLKIT